MTTQMQFANRAWRNVTRQLGWKEGFPGGTKGWKSFCREMAKITTEEDCNFTPQAEADEAVSDEISYWD